MTERLRTDLAAFFQAHHDELLRFLRRRLGTTDIATEVAQDTYLRLAASAPGTDIADPRAYMFRIATNLAIDAARRDGRRGRHVAPGETMEALPDPSPSAERVVDGRERLALLELALAELAPKPRTALILNRMDGLTHADIARRLGVSESMVAKYIAKALRHCRDRVGRPRAEN